MRAEIQRRADRAVAEPPLHDVGLDSGLEQQRRARMAKSVERDPPDFGLANQTCEHPLKRLQVHRAAGSALP